MLPFFCLNLSESELLFFPAFEVFFIISDARRTQSLPWPRDWLWGLEFKLGSEILRTVVVRDWKEIGIVGGIIALRAALTFLIHWEIKEEEKQ